MEFVREAFAIDSHAATLKAMPGITCVHISPNNFEKMRANCAFQLFGQGPLQAFFLYRTQLERKCGSIDATQKFFSRMKDLISIMTARFASEALRPASHGIKKIEDTLTFLEKWERHADKKHFLSESTAEGLRVTLTSTLELFRYLNQDVGFSYLLTSRLSQDKVESFFGIVRLSYGCNTHPTPQQFLLTVNCLSYYNLASSVVGSNVDKDLITSLLSTGEEETQKEGFFSVCKAHVEAELPSTSTSPREVEDHRYHVQRSDSRLIYYVCSYVAKKCVLPSGCSACISLLLLTAEQGRRLAASALVLHNDRGAYCILRSISLASSRDWKRCSQGVFLRGKSTAKVSLTFST